MNDPLPLLLLPGLLCDARLWRDQIAALDELITWSIADLTLDDSVEAMARRVLATAPDRFALAALSMGGYVAFEILRQAPERVSRLALLSTSAAPDSPQRAAQRRAAMSSMKLGRFMGVTDRMLPQLVHPDRVTGELGDEVKAMAARVGAEAFLRQQAAILGRPDSRPLLASIEVPTLVAVGDSDVLTRPRKLERYMKACVDRGCTFSNGADTCHRWSRRRRQRPCCASGWRPDRAGVARCGGRQMPHRALEQKVRFGTARGDEERSILAARGQGQAGVVERWCSCRKLRWADDEMCRPPRLSANDRASRRLARRPHRPAISPIERLL